MKRCHLAGVKGNDMIQRLHDNSAVRQTKGLTIDERLLRNVIILIVAENISQISVSIQFQTRDAIAGTHPDIMILILNDRMDHVIQQSITTGKRTWQIVGLLLIKIQTRISTYPDSPAGVFENGVDSLALESTG